MMLRVRLLLISLLWTACLARRMTLLNVNVLMRNGIAAPRENLLDADPESTIGKISFNSLMDAGKRQVYALGKQLSIEFGDLLDVAKENNNVNIRALNNLPCMMSAWALSLSLLEDKSTIGQSTNSKTKPSFDGKSIPKTSFDTPLPAGFSLAKVKFSDFDTKDYLFLLSSKNTCPNINTLTVKKEINELSKKFAFKDSYEAVAQKLKYNPEKYGLKGVTQLYLASRLFEFMEAANAVHKDPVFDSSSKEYQEMHKSYMAYVASTVSDPKSLSLLNSPIVNVLVKNLQESIEKDQSKWSNQAKQFHVYVAHDKFMVSLLKFLGIYDGQCAYDSYNRVKPKSSSCTPFPEPASSVEIRLYKEEIEDSTFGINYFVQIYYNGMLKNLKKQTQMPDKFIPWGNFLEYLNKRVVKDWEEECGLGQIPFTPGSNTHRLVILLVSNIVLFVFMAIAMIYCYNRTQNIKKERKSSTDKDPHLGEVLLNLNN